LKQRKKVAKGDEESRFTVGDGVMVGVDGGDGVGVVIGLWQDEKGGSESEIEYGGDEEGDKEREEEEEEEEGPAKGMMAEVHWCFRKQDLPSVMKNLNVEDVSLAFILPSYEMGADNGFERAVAQLFLELRACHHLATTTKELDDLIYKLRRGLSSLHNLYLLPYHMDADKQNEVFLAASPIRPVTTTLPITLLQKTVPIYSKEIFNNQFQYKSSVKGWAYVRTGVYWCDKAFDKGAKGGKVWSVNLDAWREGGRRGEGWEIELKELEKEEEEEVEEVEDEEVEIEEDDGDVEMEEDVETTTPRKRKVAKEKIIKKRRTIPATTKVPVKRGKKASHPKASTSNLPLTIAPEDLPTDPYQRALRLLHVGATPDSLPCREEEFVDVLSRVEEGVEGGGGGCLCMSALLCQTKAHMRYRRCTRDRENSDSPRSSQRTKTKSRRWSTSPTETSSQEKLTI
jgi:hypothetical protein